MQIQINNPDTGAMKVIQEIGSPEPQDLIDLVISKSAENPPGYHVIAGDNLGESATREVAHAVAAFGVLIWQNVLDTAP